MISVAIIDDENLVRLGIRSSVDWNARGYQVIGEAGDGLSGLKLILDKEPDLVFLDIAMPNMDGITLLKAARKQGVNCQFVILSCHDDFDYVRQSMRYGAIRYILKNEIDTVSIVELLESLRGDILQGRAQAVSVEDCAAETVRRILAGQTATDADCESLCEAHTRVAAVSLSVQEHHRVIARYEGAQAAVFSDKLTSLCAEWTRTVAAFQVKVFGCNDNTYLLLFLSNGEIDAAAVEQQILSLRAVLRGYLNVDICVGVSRPSRCPGGLEAAIHESVTAHGLFFFDPRPVRAYEEPVDVLRNEQIRLQMHELYSGALDRDYVRIGAAVHRLVAACSDIAARAVFDASPVLNGLRNMLALADLHRHGADIESILKAEGAGAFLSRLDEAIERALPASRKRSTLVEQAVRHIALHVQDDISLQGIARELHVNKSHLCRAFTREIGVPLHEYVNRLRIERAKRMIRASDIKMYDVAREVGFRNVTNFNVCFKKLVHMTPIEYKKAPAE